MIAIIDYDAGNVCSLQFALQRLGAKSILTNDPKVIKAAEKVIFPGQGAAGSAMRKLKGTGLDKLIPMLNQPVLGICLGMQLLFSKGTEDGNSKGLEFLNGKCEKFKIKNLPIPHIGFNHVEFKKSNLWKNIPNKSPFYFVHSYRVKNTSKKYNLSTTTYGEKFVSAVEKENIIGTQFHPEKSHSFGLTFIKNFVENYK